MSGLVLDAGALIAVERRDRRVVRLLELAAAHAQRVIVPAAVAAQVWRGGSRQALLARVLVAEGIEVHSLDLAAARAIGELCAATGVEDVVDAQVALLALRWGHPIVTSDPADLERLVEGRVAVIAV